MAMVHVGESYERRRYTVVLICVTLTDSAIRHHYQIYCLGPRLWVHYAAVSGHGPQNVLAYHHKRAAH